MNSDKLKNTVFVGIVEDISDPKRIGRVRVRVVNVFEEIETDSIPWASPWKDLNGNEFNVPEVGKIVSVVFDQGNPYKPEYIYAEHYNINLENKLKNLSDGAYKSMKSVIFDHKTQIYSNDDEGLKIDYKFNNINVKEDSINLNVKDNYTNLNLGDADADQPAILGNNFMEWMDKLIDNLMGSSGGPYLGNLQSPVIPNPAMIKVLQEYKKLRDPKFLSKHVYIVDNDKVSSVSSDKSRQNSPQLGDSFKSTSTSLKSLSTSDSSTSGGPQVDDNLDANSEFDPSKGNISSNPAYSGEEFGNVIISDFAKELVTVMRTQVGVMEQPMDSNRGSQVQVYQRATGLNGTGWPWCAAFICWCFKKVAESKKANYSFKLPTTAGAYDMRNWAKRNNQYIEIINNPKQILPGDVVIFNFSHVGISNGIVKNGRIDTIEGNTDGKGSREGGGVYKKSRPISIITTALRIRYNPDRVKVVGKK